MPSYGTENFLRQQVRLRDERIKELAAALRNCELASLALLELEAANFEAQTREDTLNRLMQELAATTAEAHAAIDKPYPTKWVKHI